MHLSLLYPTSVSPASLGALLAAMGVPLGLRLLLQVFPRLLVCRNPTGARHSGRHAEAWKYPGLKEDPCTNNQ